MIKKQKYLIIAFLLLSSVFSQRIQLFTKADDIFTSSNRFTVKNTKVIFWEDKVVLMTVPIRNLVEVRYAETSYSYLGKPFVLIGSVVLATTAGLAVAGNLQSLDFNNDDAYDDELLGILAAGFTSYFVGKLLNLVGARFGRDIVYKDFDHLDATTKKLILESIGLDMQKKEKESRFVYGPEGKRTDFNLSWEGKRPWKKKYKPKKKIIRFSFF
tara:strand:- start:6 stop:647 length:642 start_codon:yes stop_codon:yes gene_type:complete